MTNLVCGAAPEDAPEFADKKRDSTNNNQQGGPLLSEHNAGDYLTAALEPQGTHACWVQGEDVGSPQEQVDVAPRGGYI